MKNFLTLIRWPNLLMVAGIQTLVYFSLLEHANSILTVPALMVLIIITILLAAGGYIINDYYDTEIDKVNKPARWVAGNTLSIQFVFRLYIVINVVGLVLSTWLAWHLDLLPYLFIYPVAVLALWYYSFGLKCMPVVGNLWVSVFCGGVIGIVALPDMIVARDHVIQKELWLYMLFAAIATWYREVIKDLEDVEGDQQNNCRTAVVAFGVKAGRIMAIVLGLLLLASLLIWETKTTHSLIKTILLMLEGLTVASIAYIIWSKGSWYFRKASLVAKLIMIGGTLILFFL